MCVSCLVFADNVVTYLHFSFVSQGLMGKVWVLAWSAGFKIHFKLEKETQISRVTHVRNKIAFFQILTMNSKLCLPIINVATYNLVVSYVC